MNKEYDEYLITEQELAKMLKVNTNTIRTWVYRKLIPSNAIFRLPHTKRGTIRFIKERIMVWICGGSVNASI